MRSEYEQPKHHDAEDANKATNTAVTTPVAKSKNVNATSPLNSLKARLIISALLLIVILLPLIGITLNNAVSRQVMSAVENELNAYLYSVLAVAEVDNGELLMPDALLENQFNLIGSGLYALITRPTTQPKPKNTTPHSANPSSSGANIVDWQSDSLLGLNLPQRWPSPAIGKGRFGKILIEGTDHHIYSFSVNYTSAEQNVPLTLHIIQSQTASQTQMDAFSDKLWIWLAILMLVLLVVQLSWLTWTLKPLQKFKQELASIESGEAQQLNSHYPQELQAVAQQLNTLLNTEQNQRKRYRNALSDLAHSLKTPLAVIQSQADLSRSSAEQVDNINHIIGHQLKRAQSAAGSAWHLGVKLDNIVPKLVRTLGKIYQEPEILIHSNLDENAVFKGDEADLTEILGNLLDNACKAAHSQVRINAYCLDSQLIVEVEDDGEGVKAEQQAQIFERGIRADTYQKGHGIGLAIVSDLVDSYQGKLSLSKSNTLGGALFQCCFPN